MGGTTTNGSDKKSNVRNRKKNATASVADSADEPIDNDKTDENSKQKKR